jgi:small-conductance mechanosensitive channel
LLHAILSDGVGAAILLGLIILLILVLPRGDRRLFMGPLLLWLLHMGLAVSQSFAPHDSWAERFLRFDAFFILLIGIGRACFLLLFKGILRRLERPWPKIFLDILQTLIYLSALVISLGVAGVDTLSLLTGSAVIGVVLGFALQDTLGNLFAGLAIQLQLPFEVGDWIQFDTNPAHIGKVIEINWRATKTVTLDEVELIIPNATLGKAQINNFTKPDAYSRRSVYVNAPYDVPPQRVQQIILDAIADSWGVLDQPPPSVVTNAFDERGVQYWVRFFTVEFGKRDKVDGGVRDRIWYTLQRSGIAIPPPLRDVTWHQGRQGPEVLTQNRIAQREVALRCVDLFRLLKEENLERLAQLVEARLFAANEVILRQGDRGDELFILLRGHVEISLQQPDGTRRRMPDLGPGSFFGEMSLLTGAPRTATVAALEECELLVVGKFAFREILEATPELAWRICQVMADRRVNEAKQDGEVRTSQGAVEPAEATSSGLLRMIKQFFALRD